MNVFPWHLPFEATFSDFYNLNKKWIFLDVFFIGFLFYLFNQKWIISCFFATFSVPNLVFKVFNKKLTFSSWNQERRGSSCLFQDLWHRWVRQEITPNSFIIFKIIVFTLYIDHHIIFLKPRIDCCVVHKIMAMHHCHCKQKQLFEAFPLFTGSLRTVIDELSIVSYCHNAPRKSK